ncbi:MAG: ATP-dependent DNA ligase, partial [Comamonadaceae bacterium]
GVIPPKQYGAGRVIIWDKGTWEPEGDPAQGWREGRLKFVLQGHKLSGHWALVRMGGKAKSEKPAWLLIKEKDAYARPESEYNVVEAAPDSVAKLAPSVKKPEAKAVAHNAPSKSSRAAKPAITSPLPDAVSRPFAKRVPAIDGLRNRKPPRDTQPEEATALPPAAATRPKASRNARSAALAEPRISHGERVIDPSTGVTKMDLVRYYDAVAPLMLEHLKARPVALVRAPSGVEGEQFFQKHQESDALAGMQMLDPALDEGHAPLLEVLSAQGLRSGAQMNVVEYHTWNALKDKIERPDRMTFDLDPGENVAWPDIQEGTRLLRVLLEELGLPSFLKTSGGKGLHVVVPLKRLRDWDTVKDFSKAIVQHLTSTIPARFVAKSGPRNRVGKIFVDYLRNGRGATTVSAWSARARPGMGVSVPV